MSFSPEPSELDRLDQFMNRVLSDRIDPRSNALRLFIEHRIVRFRLRTRVSSVEVLSESYLIVRRKIQTGTVIKNFYAYFKSVSYNVIRDMCKQGKRNNTLIQRLNYRFSEQMCSDYCQEIDYSFLKGLKQALESLKKEEQIILILRFVEGASWQEIQDKHYERTNELIPLPTLRQRGARALRRLKENFSPEQT